MKIQEIRGKTDYELQREGEKLRREYFDLRFKAPVQSLQSTARLTTIKRAVARAAATRPASICRPESQQ